MKRAIWLLAALCAQACGPASTEGGAGLELTVSRALVDDVQSFQVAVLPKGSRYDCLQVVNGCLNTQVDLAQLADVTGPDGERTRAVVFAAALAQGSPRTQDISVGGIAVDRDYAVVIEALSKQSPPTLLGSSCNYVAEVRSGRNQVILAAPITAYADGPKACDPRFLK